MAYVFRAKPSLILSWLQAKGYTGTLSDALCRYVQSGSSLSKGSITDHLVDRLSSIGYVGKGVNGILDNMFMIKTGISNRGDAERVFFGNSSYDMFSTYYLGQVAGQTKAPNKLTITAQQMMIRGRHISRDTITSLRIAYPNFFVDNILLTELGPGDVSTITAAIEYPIGTTSTQVTWGGQISCTIADGEMGALSDSISVSIPENTPFMIRTYYTNSVGIITDNRTNVVDNSQSFRFAASGLSDQTTATGATTGGTSSPNFMYKPLLIVSNTNKPSVLIIGDSRQDGNASSERYTGTSDDIGEVARAVGPYFGYCNLGKGNDAGNMFLASYTQRVSLAPFFSHVICGYGYNDVRSQAQTPAATYTNLQAIRALFLDNSFYQTTIPPNTSSSDNYTTVGGLGAGDSNITTLNNLIRAGGIGNGYFELADVMESSRDSKQWKVSSGGRVVTDAAGTNASPTVTSATANFTSDDTGKILVCTALGHTSALARTMTYVDATTVTMSGNSTATLSGQTANIQAQRYTYDGAHETTEANLLISSLGVIPINNIVR